MINYDSTKHVFSFGDGSDVEYMNFLYDDKDTEGRTFKITTDYKSCWMYKSNLYVDSLCNIKVNGDNTAFIVPVYMLFNKSQESENFNRIKRIYIFYACIELIKDYQSHDNSTINFEQKYNIDLDNGWCILFLRNYTDKPEGYFSLLQESLAEYGFYTKKKQNMLNSENNPKNINVSLISPYLHGNKFINNYIKFYLYEKNPVERFRLSYQLIELLMDDVVIDKLLDKVLDCQYGVLNLRSKQDPSTEITRMNTILDKAGMKEASMFKDACVDLLKLIKPQEKSNSFPNVLYQIRNTIAHRYRLFKDVDDDSNSLVFKKLNEVCDFFECFNLELITRYKKNSQIGIDDHYKILINEVELMTS